MAAAPLDLDAGHRKAPSDDFNATTSTPGPNSLSPAPTFPLPGLPPSRPQAQPWRRRHPQPSHLPAQPTAKIGSAHLVEAPPRIDSDQNWLTWKPPNPVPLLPYGRPPPAGFHRRYSHRPTTTHLPLASPHYSPRAAARGLLHRCPNCAHLRPLWKPATAREEDEQGTRKGRRVRGRAGGQTASAGFGDGESGLESHGKDS